MNPIVYNKNGQYRFTDFVGYLPEFLRSEPDVVTYLQVMSDYINNAYRNIDVTEEFELVKACTSTDRTVVQKWMERLCDMFKLACDRGDSVMYLSVPRNNVKSNVTVGTENAEYQRTIELDLDEIVDTIPSAAEKVGTLDDGDIVYVKYKNRKTQDLVAYSFVADGDMLQKDPMATSQDPFTGTYNDPSTAIQFKVAEVGNVICRYGGKHGDMVFYEVYFPVHVTNVERVSATGVSTYDVNGDGKSDNILVDYYNLTSAAGTMDVDSNNIGTYNTYIKFGNKNGFGWVGEYPTGMFYFRDSSAANLTNLSSSGTMDISDTLNKPSVDRYHINRIEKRSGEYRIYLDAFPGLYSNAVFYIMDGSKSCGVYRMNESITSGYRFDSGELYIDVVNISNYNYDDQILGDHTDLTLLVIPLAESKYILDFDNSLPLVKWSTEVTDLFEHSIGTSSNLEMKRAKKISNELIFTGKVSRISSSIIQVEQDLSDKIHQGDIIYSTAFMYPYIAEVSWCSRANNGMFRISLAKCQIDVSKLSSPVSISRLNAGIITGISQSTATESDYVYFDASWQISFDVQPGDYFVSNVKIDGSPTAKDVLFQVERIAPGHGGATICARKPYGMNITIDAPSAINWFYVDEEIPASIYAFDYIKHQDDSTMIGAAKRKSYIGDIFSAQYMFAVLKGSDEYSLLYMDTDVKHKTAGALYKKGDFVYDDDTRQVYKITREVVVSETGEITDVNRYIIDKVFHYSIGVKEVTNTYMPYCGPISTLDYEDTIDYAGNMSTQRLPLYIKKINDVRLKYGWKQREYVYYHDNIGVAPMSRSGFVETYSDNVVNDGTSIANPRSPVNINLRKQAHILPANAVLSGCGEKWYTLDIDSTPIAQRIETGEWVITVQSSGHGLSVGSVITATVTVEDEDKRAVFNAENTEISYADPYVFQYKTNAYTGTGYVMSLSSDDDLEVKYDRSYVDNPNLYPMEGDVVVVGAHFESLSSFTDYDYMDNVYPILPDNTIAVDGTLYLVRKGAWKVIDPTDIITPHAIYCRHNLFDVSKTNPTFAISDGYVIKSITPDNESHTAEILMSSRIPELDSPNASVYNDNGRVYIEFVNQGALCGWHTIKEVHNGGAFSIYLDPSVTIDDYIAPITNRRMTASVGRWYKYTLNSYDWDKKSNLVSYVTSNEIKECQTIQITETEFVYRYKMKYKHNLSVGDHVLIDATGKIVYDVAKWDSKPIKTAIVTAVVDEYSLELDQLVERPGYIYKGYIISGRNLTRLSGEYSIKLGDEFIKFKDGDIVITKDQVCLDERRGWKVTANTAWIPMSAKRTFKIDEISVDIKRNPAYDAGDDFDNEAEYKYVTVSDADVAADTGAYTIGYACARNYHFEHPHIEYLDTTQNTELEYSSKYDYASVAPRDDMDPLFKGVPDMGYPLAERIERLAYLRDPEVLDIDLIGYLARFMGYDITAVADDIRSSNIYRNSMEREAALRETIAHLPQYYALSGTKPGINMLMATFGLVGELITMWTNTSNPYGTLIRQDDVANQMDVDLANGDTTSSWVPTPHVVLDIIENDNFNSVLMGNEELNRMKEQIRCCKPIQVVFDGIRVVYKTVVELNTMLVASGGALTDSTYMLDVEPEADKVLIEDPCADEDCSF